MNLNAYILLEQMTGIEDHYFHSSPLQRELSHLTVLEKEIPIRTNCIYLAMASDIPILEEINIPYTLVTAGKGPSRYTEDSNCDLLCCRKEYTIGMLFDMIHRIFLKYDEWEKNLLNVLIEKKDLNHLCRVSLPIFENPILLLGENHELLAVAEQGELYKIPYEYRQKDTDYLSEKVLSELLLDPEYAKTFTYNVPELYTDAEGIQCIYMNIFIDERYAARICIDGITRYPTNGDKAAMCVFAEIAESVLKDQSYSSYSSLLTFKSYLTQYLKDENSIPTEVLEKTLNRIHWSVTDRYFCIVLEPNERDFQGKGINYDCNMLEKKYLGSIALIHNKQIILIFNMHVSPQSRKELLADIVYTVREKLMKSGISTEYENFYDISAYYHQAQAALETGKKYDEMVWQYKFEDYSLQYVIDQGTKALPLKALLPEGLTQILKHDREHGSAYYQTLRTYMENDMSTSKAIDDLYVHRSTFKYRMKRVQEMLMQDLNTPEVKLYLMILFRIID